MHSVPAPGDICGTIAQILQLVLEPLLEIRLCQPLAPFPPHVLRQKSTIPGAEILPPQAFGICFWRTDKNTTHVFTSQIIFGLRVGVGHKGSLRRGQKERETEGISKPKVSIRVLV